MQNSKEEPTMVGDGEAEAAAQETALIRSGLKKSVKDRTPDEATAVRKYNREQQRDSRARTEARKDVGNSKYSSKEEVSKKEAKRILTEERLIRNPRIVEVCVELAEVACRNLKIPMNAHIFTHGVQKTLEAVATKKEVEPPAIEDVWKAGERIREHELHALWDYSASWRKQPDGTQISFEDWRAYRRRCITDVVWFGNFVLGKDFQAEPHGVWAKDLFPQLEPALLSLPEKFGQKDIAKAFYALSNVRQRCLIAARSSFKSTFSTVFTLALMLCFAGSVRILVSTATQPLAKGFARSFRSMLTLRDPNNPTLLNQLWAEHCISPDEGKSLEYTSPFRQLDALIEPTLMATSVISEGQAGMRYDLAVMDDCAEISNSSTQEMRAKTQERIDMLRELGEPHSLTNYVGTPISSGLGTEDDPGDLYSVLLRREEKNQSAGEDPKLLYAICPAWTVKAGVSKKAWDSTLTEDDVVLLFPSRLTFKYLMGKLKECLATDTSAKIFRQQSLVSWVPDDESQITVTFTEAALRSKLRPRSFFNATALPGTPVYMATDDATSVSRYADFSAISVVRAQPVSDVSGSTNALVVLDISYGRWKHSEKITHICRVIEQHSPSAWVLEKDRGHEELVLGVRKMCHLKGLVMPHVMLRDIKNGPQAKALKVKILEAPLEDGRLWFTSGHWNDACFQQFVRFDGIKKSGSTDGSKDDIPDCVATAYQVWGPRAISETIDPAESERRRQEDEAEGERERRRHFYNAMFGNNYTPPPKPRELVVPEKPVDPRKVILGRNGPWRF
jgi:hypothetical protein